MIVPAKNITSLDRTLQISILADIFDASESMSRYAKRHSFRDKLVDSTMNVQRPQPDQRNLPKNKDETNAGL